jgi:hypothetical protein
VPILGTKKNRDIVTTAAGKEKVGRTADGLCGILWHVIYKTTIHRKCSLSSHPEFTVSHLDVYVYYKYTARENL